MVLDRNVDSPHKSKFKNGYKSKHVTIAPEEVNRNMYYSLSLNPNNQFDDHHNSKYGNRVNLIVETWGTILTKFNPNSFSYHLRLESKNGRLHFHGVIRIKDPLTFDVLVLPIWKELCTYEIDTINDMDKWITYCTKCEPLWKGSIYNHILFRGIRDFPKAVLVEKKEHPIICQAGERAPQ